MSASERQAARPDKSPQSCPSHINTRGETSIQKIRGQKHPRPAPWDFYTDGKMTLYDGHDQQGRFLPGHKAPHPFTPGHEPMGGRPPGSPNKPYDSSKELFFERHIETAIADKFCDLVAGMVGDLGGWDNLAVGQLQLIRRCAMISTKCEIMEREAAEG